MITVSQVANILLPWLGSALLDAFRDECDQIQRYLNSPKERQALQALCDRLAVYLYGRVRLATKSQMVVVPDGGYPIRMRAEDFAIIADDLLFLIFQDFTVDAEHLLVVREFSMQCASLSALRALYTRFAPLQTADELQTIAQIARGSYPPFRLRGWLDTPQTSKKKGCT